MKIPEIEKRLDAVLNFDKPDETDLFMYGAVVNAAEPGFMLGLAKSKDTISAREVREKLAGIKTGTINLHINSGGGSASDGIAIHNMLRQHPARIVAYIDGLAASAASVIAMAADEIIMPENTVMMVHRASTAVFGNAETLMEEAEKLRTFDDSVFNSYRSRFIGSDDELRVLIEKETFLSAVECYQLGFCDKVLVNRKTVTENAADFKAALLCKYSKSITQSETEPAQSVKPNAGELVFNLLSNIGGRIQ